MPTTTDTKIIFFSKYRISKQLQDAYLKYYVKCKTILVENLTQFLSVILDFLNKIMPPVNLNSVTYSQERLVNDFHNWTYTSDDTPDLLNTLDFKDSKLLACLYEDVSLESLISLYIDELPLSVRCTYYNRSFISDDYCRKVVVLFHQMLLKLHNYFPIYLAFENKRFVNKLVTDIFGKHLSCIPDMNDIVGLSAQEICQISQTLSSVLCVAQLLQQL